MVGHPHRAIEFMVRFLQPTARFVRYPVHVGVDPAKVGVSLDSIDGQRHHVTTWKRDDWLRRAIISATPSPARPRSCAERPLVRGEPSRRACEGRTRYAGQRDTGRTLRARRGLAREQRGVCLPRPALRQGLHRQHLRQSERTRLSGLWWIESLHHRLTERGWQGLDRVGRAYSIKPRARAAVMNRRASPA